MKILNEKEVADWLGVTPGFLSKARVAGTGPVFHRIGRRIGYAQADVEAWLSARHVQSTSQKVAA